MLRFYLEDVTFGTTQGDDLLGDIGGSRLAELKLRTQEYEELYILAQETFDVTFFTKSDVSFFADDYENAEIESLDDDLDREMVSMERVRYESVFQYPEYPYFLPLRLLIYLLDIGEKEAASYVNRIRGCYLNEIDIPNTEYEEEYNRLTEEDEDSHGW